MSKLRSERDQYKTLAHLYAMLVGLLGFGNVCEHTDGASWMTVPVGFAVIALFGYILAVSFAWKGVDK